MFGLIAGLAGPVVKGIAGYFTKKQDIKKAKVTASAKLALKKETGDQEITLSDAEWEAIGQKGMGETWKDEYVTIIITGPIVGVLVGAVWAAFTVSEELPNGNDKLLTGTLKGIEQLNALGLNWDTLTMAVVFAAIGLKMWRAK